MARLFLWLLALIGATLFTYFCFQDKSESIKNDLLSNVKSKLLERGIKGIDVDLEGSGLELSRRVVLEGKVSTLEMKKSAISLAKKSIGIEGVIDRISINEKKNDKTSINEIKKMPNDTNKSIKEDMITNSVYQKPLKEVNTQQESKDKAVHDIKNIVEPDFKTNFEIVTKKVHSVKKEEPTVMQDKKDDTKSALDCQKRLNSIMAKNKIHFEYNKATIKKDSYALLDQIATTLKECKDKTIIVGGHTDSIGSYGYNQKLSEKRADAVKRYLLQKGLDKKSIIAVGYGERKPIASNMEKEGRAKNRRIEFKIKGVEK